MYFAPVRKWWWLVLAATLIGLAASAVVLSRRPPTYQARATLMIGRTINDPNPTSAEFGLGDRLAGTYAELARRDPVRNATMAALGLKKLPLYETRPVSDAQLVEILVTDISPARAQAVANELAHQVILLSPTRPLADEQGRQQFVRDQLSFLQQRILETQDEMTARQKTMVDLSSAADIARAQDEISTLQTKLTALQTNYATLLANSESGATNVLSLIEPAVLPVLPIGPSNLILTLLAGVSALVLASGTAYLLEFMDTSLKTPEEALQVVQVPAIGLIGEIQSAARDGGKAALPLMGPQAAPAIREAFRSLWTNLEFAAVDMPLRTILVASPAPDEGKTTIAVNLALMMAQAGKRAALIDADMRRPGVHQLLGLANQTGLSDLFLGRKTTSEAVRPWGDSGLLVLSAGSPPPNPTELLSSRKMDQILGEAKQFADVIVIDAPPFGLADASVLASKVDGVILVIRPGYTLRNAVRAMQAQLARSGAHVIGMVLNRVPRGQLEALGGYTSYYDSESEKTDKGAASAGHDGVSSGASGKAPGRGAASATPFIKTLDP
jgi:succinoglycan biosynthesis transport protein ExoP